MANVYRVILPSHAGGKKYDITAGSENKAKEILCKALKRDRVPRGTTIEKTGKAAPKPQDTPDDSMRNKAKAIKKVKPKPLTNHERKEHQEYKQEQKEKDVQSNSVCVDGLYLLKSDMVRLKSQMTFSDVTLYVEEDNNVGVFFIGDDAEYTMKRGVNFWLYIDHTKNKTNLKELQKHI